MDNLKKLVREQLSKKKVKLSEQSDPEVTNARNALFNVADERLLQALRSLEGIGQVGDFLVDMIEFVNKVSPAPDITRQLAHQYIDKSMTDDFVRDDEESDEFDINPELGDEENLSEISTPGNTKEIEDKIKSGKLDLKKLQDATEKAMKGDTTALTSIMTGIDIVDIDEEMEEISTSAGAGAYLTKAAFKPKYGYKVVKKKSEKDS